MQRAITLLDSIRGAVSGKNRVILETAIELINGSPQELARMAADRARKSTGKRAEFRTDSTQIPPGIPAENGLARASDSDPIISESPSGPRNSSDLSVSFQLPSGSGSTTVASEIAPARRKPPAKPRVSADAELCAAAWRAYAAAYMRRYGVGPVRNAKVNAQLRQLCERLPGEDVVETIAHYLRSQNARYVAAGHAVGPLLQDCEKLRTEMVTGRTMTAESARQLDHNQAAGEQVDRVVAILEERDRKQLGRF